MKNVSIKLSLFLSVTCLFLGILGYTTFAVPGSGVLLQYSQPTGESFKAAQQGDEKFNWVTAETGEVITQDKNKYWTYAQKINGKIQASKYKYSKSGQKPLQIIKNNDVITMVKKGTVVSNSPKLTDVVKTDSTTNLTNQIQGSTSQTASGQPTNTQKILVLLVQFSDIKMKYTDAQWSNSFFGTTGSSVNAYYNEVSGGKFGFVPPEESNGTANDGVIKVTLNYPNPNTGGNIGYANQKIVIDALAAASPYINYASFDANNDKYMAANELHIVTVAAGYEAAYGGGLSPSIWAHKWSTSTTVQEIRFSEYTQESEVHYDHMATIGVLAHELGHDLGLPDLYDYDGTSQGVGIHSIMAGGSWAKQTYAGDSPTHMDAWSKIKLGFATPTLTTSGDYTINSFNTGQYNILKVQTSNPDQYFLVENRQNVGYDKGLSGNVRYFGIAIWHIDESILRSNYWRPNDNETRKGVDLEEANEGKLGYSQLDKKYGGYYDHYYSLGNVTAFGTTTVPNSNLYGGIVTNIKIAANVSSSNSMTVNISNNNAEVPPQITNVSVDSNPFVPDGVKTAAISYKLSKDAYVSISIYDANNTLIRTIENNVLKTTGTLSAIWDGKDATGKIVGDAIYSFKIAAVDKVGLTANPATGTIIVETQNPTISNVGDSPDPYSGAVNTFSTISYTLSENANVNIKIYDSNNNLVNTLVNGQVLGGARNITWTGKDSIGKPSKNGIYTYKINATDAFNNIANEIVGTITLDRGAPITLTLYGHKPDSFKLNTKVTYGITQPGIINLKFYDSNNNLVRNLINNSQRQAGTYYTTWTGRDDSGKPVSSGVYTYIVQAEDNGGNIAGPFTGTVTVDRSGPIITNISASDYPFTPSGSNSTTVSYNLSKDGKFSANLYSPSGALLRTIVNKAVQSVGANNFLWDGKNKYDEIVSDGTYTIKTSAIDSLGNRSTTVIQTVTIQTTAPFIDNVTDNPDPLKLGDGTVSTIQYTLSKDAHVSVKLFDASGNLVKTLIDVDNLAGVRQAVWDGTENNGKLVTDGVYVYKINAVDAFGMASQEVSGTITTDKTPVIISNVSINPLTFMPSGAIFYTISKDAKVTLKIYNSSNQEVRTLENAASMTAGVHSSVWDGKTSSGADAVPGSYTFKITAVDNSGFNATPVSGTIIVAAVDKTVPTVTNVSDSPDPIKLGTGGVVSIKYTLSEDAFVILKIFDSKNNLIRTLVNRNISAGNKNEDWDGKDDLGGVVLDGTYVYRINATDNAGNTGNEVVGTITTDKTPVTISNVSVNPAKFATSGTIYYTLSEISKVTITIYDGLNNEVRRLVNAQSINGGDNSVLWDGKDNNGLDVQSGNYTIVITAIDQVGFLATSQGTISVDAPAPLISNQSSSPEPFIADGTSSATITYTITTNASVTIKIYNSSNTLIRTLQNGAAAIRGQNTVSWNGKNNGAILQGDGVYTYKINAVDAVGKASNEAIGTITIDKTSPSISNVSVSPNPVASGSATTIAYNISEKANITVTIADSSGNIVRTLENNALKNAGANTVIWDSKDNSGSILTGTYNYKIVAVDMVKFTAQKSGSITVIDSSTPVISNTSSSPEPFASNGTSTVNISYTLSKDMSVSLKIYDVNNNPIKTLINNVQQIKGNNVTWWNGKNDAGVLVNEGIYTYKINGVDGLGKTAVEVKGIITAGLSLNITNDAVSSDPFKAINLNTVNIAYTLSKNANVTVKILDSLNNVIKTLLSGLANSGSNSVTWNGKDAQGSIVKDGIYTYKIEASDSIGQIATVLRNFTVVGSDPETSNVSDSPDPFKPDGSLVSINYTLSKNSLVTIEIFDSNSKLVRQLFKDMSLLIGFNTSFWEGKDISGNIVSDGVYTYKITAVDPYSKASVQAVGTITVQMYPPAGTLSNVSITPNPFAQNSGNSAIISYTLTGEAYIIIVINDSNNSLVKTVVSNSSKTSGAYTVNWDGKDSSGKIVSDGLYLVKISALNGLGVGSTVTNNLTVESTPPVISGVNDSPDPFKPDNITLWDLNFNLSEDANVYLEVRDSNNNIVWSARPVIFTKGARAVQLYGTNDSGQLLSDGVYSYKLWAMDFLNKKSNEATGTLTIDKTTPVISGVGASPTTFGSSTTVSYSLSENAKVTVKISSGSTAIRTLENNISKNSGVNSIVWDGNDDNGIAVGDGSYTYTITAVDGVGLSGSTSGTVTKSTGAPVISNVSSNTDVFKPSGSNTATINFTLNKNALVGINIYDSSGKLVKTLLDNYPVVKGASSSSWDGKNNSGTIVLDGNYTYRINAVDTVGISAVQVGGAILIDRTAPVISSFIANPYPFAPDGSSKMTISYNLSESVTQTISILDDLNNVLTILVNGQWASLSTNTLQWDGTANGIILDDDIYRVKLTATDLAGNSTDYYDYVAIDRFAPQIVDVNDEPDPFNPNIAQFNTIHAGFTEYVVTATANIYDSNNTVVKGIGMNDILEFFWGWSGTNSTGSLVKDGVYSYKIDATDMFDKDAQEASGTITVDTTVPVISQVSFVPELETPSGTISYNISKAGKITITLYNSLNNPIRNIEIDAQKSAGANSVYWDGKDNSGKFVGYGIYTFKITAVDVNGSPSLPAVGVITFETIDSDVFDNLTNETDIVAAPGAEGTVTPATGTTEPTQIINQIPVIVTSGENTPTTNSNNKPKQDSVVKSRPVITGVFTNPAIFAPIGTINYTTHENLKVTTVIYDSTNKIIRILEGGIQKTKGTFIANWDGKDQSGNLVISGVYTFKITFENAVGLMTVATGSIQVDASKLTITASFNPNPYNPRGGNGGFAPATIYYNISETASVTAGIYKADGSQVKVLSSGERKNAGANGFIWIGIYDNNVMVQPGIYTYKISGVTDTGKRGEASGTFTVN